MELDTGTHARTLTRTRTLANGRERCRAYLAFKGATVFVRGPWRERALNSREVIERSMQSSAKIILSSLNISARSDFLDRWVTHKSVTKSDRENYV